MTSMTSQRSNAVRDIALVTVLLVLTARSAMAQTTPANSGAIKLTAGVDTPSVYFLRGIRQEIDPKFTMFPYGDIGVALSSKVNWNFGVWNSLHTGSSGGDGPGPLHYEEDFYTSLSIAAGSGVTVTPMFRAYTSPNLMFRTVKEVSFKVAQAGKVAPYGLVAYELGGSKSGQADRGYLLRSGGHRGAYAEFGVAPSWPLGGGKATLAVPLKIGLSLKDYYENPLTGKDEKFGFFDGGVLVTVPLSSIGSNYGSWNVHVGVDFFALGETTKLLNNGDKGQVIGMGGIGLSY